MSFSHGKDTEVCVDQFDVTEWFKGLSVDVAVDTADSTTFRKDWREFTEGQIGGSLGLEGYYEASNSGEVMDRLSGATPIVSAGPAGLGVGALVRMLKAKTTALTKSAPIGDMTLMNWDLIADGEISFGYSLHSPTVEITADGNDLGVDTGAAVTGALWVAHFHLLDLDATNITLTVQDSADGSTDWQPITGVTSGSLTAPGVVRVTGTGNVRRHIRATRDVNGGASTASFQTSFARKAA